MSAATAEMDAGERSTAGRRRPRPSRCLSMRSTKEDLFADLVAGIGAVQRAAEHDQDSVGKTDDLRQFGRHQQDPRTIRSELRDEAIDLLLGADIDAYSGV